jgi:hypothetical protein
MIVITNINFKDFLKAVLILAKGNGFFCKYFPTKGSAIRFELFNKKDDREPVKMWVVHKDLKTKKIYSGDLKKACKEIGVMKKDFENLITNKFKVN